MKFRYVIAATILLSGCTEDAVGDLVYHCGTDIQSTVAHSAAVIYGAETWPPVTSEAFPIDEAFLERIDRSEAMSLVAVNAAGAVFSTGCDKLCDADEAMAVISQCRNTAGCKIVGGVKNSTFYPFYTSDRNGGHLCSRS